VETGFDASDDEQAALMGLVKEARRLLDIQLTPKPDGYNVGFNSGAGSQGPQTRPAQTEILSPRPMATISNHRAAQTNRVGQSPLREHSVKTVSEHAWRRDRIELLPLNPDYEPITVAPHEGPEMVVAGEWVATIE
jgi:hypothetical protein